jgi:endonuclease/exonuclease/phosphatase (EEP) superfamily protein YafD
MKIIESDIVSLQEVSTPDYTKDFAEKIGHQHYIQAPDNDTGLVSRWPIARSAMLQNGSKQVIRAEIETGNGLVAVYAVHITPPFTNSMYQEGIAELKQLSEWVTQDELPVIIGGDLNTAIYSPEMRTFTSNLSSTIKPTTEQRWPQCSWYGHGKLLCLRIDHIFIPQSSNFYGSTISPDLGSDHRAITVRLSL